MASQLKDMDNNRILTEINQAYPMQFSHIELLREGGNATYMVHTSTARFFLKVVGTAFADTFIQSVSINLYLQQKGFTVPRIILTGEGRPYIDVGTDRIVLYEYLEMTEIEMTRDAEEVGTLLGQLHQLMKEYSGELVNHDKAFYLDRYVSILNERKYSRATEFEEYGKRLWTWTKALPRGYTHGDMYSGNIARGADGKLYILDFDTSCIGFPMYDLALICNQTNYFDYDVSGLQKTIDIYERLLSGYIKHVHEENKGACMNTAALCDMLALYHFALQATIIEIYGPDCVDDAFFDRQLAWLKRWEAHTAKYHLT